MDEMTNKQVGGEWMDRQVDGLVDIKGGGDGGWMDRWMGGRTDGLMVELVDMWMSGWKDK